MENQVDRFIAQYGVPSLIICHEKNLAVVVQWVDTHPDWEDIMVRPSPSGGCPRGQLFFVAVPDQYL